MKVRFFAAVAASVLTITGLAASAEAACNKNVKIVNETCCTDIWSFQASPTGQDAWGPDQLEERVIPPGYHRVFWMDDGSNQRFYDFRAVMANGQVMKRFKIDVCTTRSWTITD